MEFKTREVKKPEMPPDAPPEYSFENKMLFVSLICEPFELSTIDKVEEECTTKSMGRNYNEETRNRTITYDISEGQGELVKDVTVYWNNWVNGKGAGKKVRYAIREARKTPE